MAFTALLLMTSVLQAQQITGFAVYQSKTRLPEFQRERDMPADVAKQVEEQLKKQMEKTYTLKFTKTESIFIEDQKITPSGKMPEGLKVNVIGTAGGKRYRNIQRRENIAEDEIFGKEFLIVDSLRSWDWQLTSESKKVGDYTCYKATATIKVTKEERDAFEKFKADKTDVKGRTIIREEPKDVELTAWYAPEIPVNHGPDEYWGLPGLILEASDGRTTMLCSKIVINPKDKVNITKPVKGEKVTQKEFDDIRRRKIEEIHEVRQGRGDGTMQIRIGG
jgi:GLPGLI family protein